MGRSNQVLGCYAMNWCDLRILKVCARLQMDMNISSQLGDFLRAPSGIGGTIWNVEFDYHDVGVAVVLKQSLDTPMSVVSKLCASHYGVTASGAARSKSGPFLMIPKIMPCSQFTIAAVCTLAVVIQDGI